MLSNFSAKFLMVPESKDTELVPRQRQLNESKLRVENGIIY